MLARSRSDFFKVPDGLVLRCSTPYLSCLTCSSRSWKRKWRVGSSAKTDVDVDNNRHAVKIIEKRRMNDEDKEDISFFKSNVFGLEIFFL